ncbi:MAG: crAss001_48 related protein [Eubacterium sp.]
MRKYVGTKIIEAKEMNRGDYNKYRGWTIPENENPNDEGYLVRYSDGYESWSPKKQFEDAYRNYDEKKLPSTAILMQSSDYKERFKAEYLQLVIRYKGLKAMLEKWDNGTLPFKPTCPRSTYNIQIKAMRDYIAILEARAVMEGVDLESEV